MTKKSFSWKRVALIFAIATVTMSTTAVAQEKGDMAAGGNLTLGSGDSYTNVGIGAKFRYNVTAPLRLEGSFTYFLKKDYLNMWDLSVNGHWLFPAGDRLTLYPLAGLGILGWKYSYDFGWGVDGSASDSDIAFDLGGGVDFTLTGNISLNAELKYKIADHWDRLLLSAGVTYKF
ncbi:MAG: porin family protein [Dysgonamonadaceae bacterium]|jgi:outer membrane protein X|nr:porin family protein [Dysgonamonadaceae bacterium]